MRLCILSGRRFEDTFEDAQWRKVQKMQPVRLCILWCKHFEETYENTQWREVKQMHPMWLCILWGRQFEDTFKNAQWRKTKQMQPMQLCILWGRQIKETLENTQQREDILKFTLEKSQTKSVRMIAFVGIMATKKGFRSAIFNVAEAYNFDSWHNCG